MDEKEITIDVDQQELVEVLLKENKELLKTIKQIDNLIKIYSE